MPDPFDPIRTLINPRLTETGVPSLVFAVAKDGEIIWEEGFGWANRERRLAADPHVMYSLASISKPITATALMILVERGQIDLDAPLNEYLGDAKVQGHIGASPDGHGDFPGPVEAARGATVRRVANHTSGLPLHYHFFHEDEGISPPHRDLSILRYGHLVSAPGERYQYANFGYGLLDYIIQRVSSVDFATFLRKEVFDPLGMTRASLHIGQGLEPFAAERYDKNGVPISFYDFDHPGASAVFCSAHDLVRFGMFHLGSHLPDQHPILTDDTIASMQLPTVETEPDVGYGIGWRVAQNQSGYHTVSHDGSMGGVRTRLILVPSENLAIVVLCNASDELPIEITQQLLNAVLPGYEVPQRVTEDNDQIATQPAFAPHPGLVGPWHGAIHTDGKELPLALTIEETGRIEARVDDQPTTVLNEPTFENDRLRGQMAGDLRTEDAARRPYDLKLDLALRWNVLNGSVTAISRPGPRLGNALSYWCELDRSQ